MRPATSSSMVGKAMVSRQAGTASSREAGGLWTAWDDYGQSLDERERQPDVIVQYNPTVPSRGGTRIRTDCSTAEPCIAGEGNCESDAECAPGLVCGVSNGRKFGHVDAFRICVPAHCQDGVRNHNEQQVDCGGECGACLYCGNGVVDQPSEACDDGAQTNQCDLDCTLPVCGDGLVNPAAGEQCEPGSSPSCNCQTINPCASSGGCPLKVVHRPAGTATDATIRPVFRILNDGLTSVPLNQLTVRYWFTIDPCQNSQSCTGVTLTPSCNSAYFPPSGGTNQCTAVGRSAVTVTPGRKGASHYLDVSCGKEGQKGGRLASS